MTRWRRAAVIHETRHTLQQRLCGGMSRIPEGSVDLAFADPPFNIGYKYDVYEDRRAADDYLAWTEKWGRRWCEHSSRQVTAWLAIGDDFAAELKLIFQRELGLYCRSWVIWYYTFGVNCSKKFSRSHTHLFHFVKDPEELYFQWDAIRVPSARQLVYADSRADSKGRLPDDTWILRPQDAVGSFHARRKRVVLSSRVRHVQRAGGLARLPDARAIARPNY